MKKVILIQPEPKNYLRRWRKAIYNFTGAEELEPVLAVLLAWLDASSWKGSPNNLIEALPNDASDLTIYDLRDILLRLGFKSKRLTSKQSEISQRLCPCILVDDDRLFIVKEENGEIFAVDPLTHERKPLTEERESDFYVIYKVTPETSNQAVLGDIWFRDFFYQFRPLIYRSLVSSFFINLLALAIPLAIMMVYDQVVSKESPETLVYVASGVGIALTFELLMRIMRAKEAAYMGARFDYLLSTKIFEQIIHLPPMFTERAPVSEQVSRIRSFESLREIFTGPLANTLFDLPFTLLFIAVIGLIAGPLVIIPIVLGAVYVIIGLVLTPEIRTYIQKATMLRSKRFNMLFEMLWNMRQVKQRCGEDHWEKRFRKISGDSAWAGQKVSNIQSNLQNIAQTLMTIAGVATLVFGVLAVMDGTLSLGALIAIMMLVWRILAPLQAVFNMLNRIEQIKSGLGQLKSILRLEMEQAPGDAPNTRLEYKGAIEFNRVSIRYRQDLNPALLGVSFTVNPGEIVAVTGHSGAGKTTLAKLILGLYRPQAGVVTLDGIDIRQLRPITLRQTLAYVPQTNHVFPGTLYENLILANPTASFAHVRKACRKAGILETIEALPMGFDTEFNEGVIAQIPQSFAHSIAMGRAFLRNAPILILDEPTDYMDEKESAEFLKVLENIRGLQTIVLITQRPTEMRICDRLMVLEDGQVSMLGKPDEVLPTMFQSQFGPRQSDGVGA